MDYQNTLRADQSFHGMKHIKIVYSKESGYSVLRITGTSGTGEALNIKIFDPVTIETSIPVKGAV